MPSRSAAATLASLLSVAAFSLLASASCASGTAADASSLDVAGGDAGMGTTRDAAPVPTCNADLESDPQNCGACGKTCTSSETCTHGVCLSVCPEQQSQCPGVGCVDLSTDLNNCGGCGAVCTAPDAGGANAVCASGHCAFGCPATPGVQACPDGCIDVTRSNTDCGGCGIACPSGQTCQDGVCCGDPGKMCGGICVDVTQDASNCGACGHACAAGSHCASGACVGYTTAAAATAFVDACTLTGHQVVLASTSGWEESAVVPMPISFTFFGEKQSQFWIGSQGTIGFGAQPAQAYSYPTCPLPDSSSAYAAIVAFGDYLDTRPAGICYGTTGTAPSRQLVVTWSRATHEMDTGSVLTFSVILDEAAATIDVVYETATPGTDGGGYVRGNGATVGLQSPGGTYAAQYACGQGTADLYNATPFAVRFTPL